ncbi:MAG: M23 family metallopeptidase [Oscillospiraceae bacterium]|nr:M23 family metallopeptidase [Oscillospiraceae bacterium]
MHNKIHSKRTGRLSFYLVMLLCAVMIGVSCWFAYTQTAQEITLQLDSALDGMPAADLEVRVPLPTEAPAARPAAPAEQSAQIALTVEVLPETQAAPALQEETAAEATEPPTVPTPSLYLPAGGEIIGDFSHGELVRSQTTGVWQTHNGIDIAGSLGDPVYAMADGIVSEVRDDPLWGICVTIDHQNGMYSRYCGMNPGLNVCEGDAVSGGAVIGAFGDSADAEHAMDTHLHFEVLQGEHYIDPCAYLNAQSR